MLLESVSNLAEGKSLLTVLLVPPVIANLGTWVSIQGYH